MTNTIFATKSHLTQTWDQSGQRYPVTVLNSHPLQVSQVKNTQKDGYKAVQVVFGPIKKRLAKAQTSSLAKAGIDSKHRYTREIKFFGDSDLEDLKPGDTIKPEEIIKIGDQISVAGTSKGKGFAGVVKRWGFAGGPKTHGQSDRHRAPGSIGQGTTPGRVFKGKKMAGRLGNQRHTIKNLLVLDIKPSGEIWIKGTVPGATGSLVIINKTGETKFKSLHSDKSAKEVADSKESSTSKPKESKPADKKSQQNSNEKSTTETQKKKETLK